LTDRHWLTAEDFMKRVLLASLAAAVVCAMAGAGIQAQDGRLAQSAASPQRNWYSVAITTVKPDRVAEWLEIQKSQTIPMQQKGGVKSRETWQSGAPFGEGNSYGIVTPIDNFATYDMPNLARRVLGEAPGRAYQDKLAALTVSRRTFAVQDRAELSLPPAASAKIVAAILQDVTVISGHAEQYESYFKDDVLPVLKKGNVLGMAVSRTVFGGNGNEYHLVTYLDSFAEIDKGPAQVRVLGQPAAAALASKGAQHIANIERTILRFVPDLSFRPRPAS
jgi:hypothetical protein